MSSIASHPIPSCPPPPVHSRPLPASLLELLLLIFKQAIHKSLYSIPHSTSTITNNRRTEKRIAFGINRIYHGTIQSRPTHRRASKAASGGFGRISTETLAAAAAAAARSRTRGPGEISQPKPLTPAHLPRHTSHEDEVAEQTIHNSRHHTDTHT